MKVRVKMMKEGARVPVKAHDSVGADHVGADFCYDVYAVSEEEIAPGVWRYGLGLAFEMNADTRRGLKMIVPGVNILDVEDLSYFVFGLDIRPRSSIWKTGMVFANATGTVDDGYRGEVSMIFYHVMKDMPRYRVGDRIGQMKVGLTLPIEFEVVDELGETERGAGAYGSTGR